MKDRTLAFPHALRAALLGLSLAAVAACDNTPNANFKQDLEAGQAASQGDRYASLDTAPTLQSYGWWSEGERASRASAEADRFRDIYQSMLTQWQADARAAAVVPVAEGCAKAFAAVLDDPRDPSVAQAVQNTSEAASPAQGETVFAALVACRQSAQESADQGERDGEQRMQLAVIKRFASSGMVLVGLRTMARGEIDAGLAQWRDGRALLDEDKAGFKLSLQSLRGW